MYIDVTHIEVSASADGLVGIALSNTKMDQARTEAGRDPFPITVYLSITEAMYALSSFLGKASFYPYFSDGIYLLRPTSHGARLIHLDGSQFHDHWVTFPGQEFAHFVEIAIGMARRLKSDKDRHRSHMEAACKDKSVPSWLRPKHNYDIARRTWKHVLQPETIEYWTKKYGPQIKVVWHRDADKHYEAALTDDRVVTLHRRYTLADQVESLKRRARNASDGNVVTVNIYPDHAPYDSKPMSFYWVIERHGQRYMNGGIIAHPNRADEPDVEWHDQEVVSYEYSTHS